MSGRALNAFLRCCGWISVVAIVVIAAWHTFPGEARTIKAEILAASARAGDGSAELDLAAISTLPVDRMCLQSPYLIRRWMEERVGRPLPKFSVLDDERRFVLWIFRGDSEPLQITFNRSKELNYSMLTIARCTSSSVIKVEKRKWILG